MPTNKELSQPDTHDLIAKAHQSLSDHKLNEFEDNCFKNVRQHPERGVQFIEVDPHDLIAMIQIIQWYRDGEPVCSFCDEAHPGGPEMCGKNTRQRHFHPANNSGEESLPDDSWEPDDDVQ